MLLCMVVIAAGCATAPQRAVKPPKAGGEVVAVTALARANAATGVDAYAAGRQAALELKGRLAGVEPHVVLLAECFVDKADKARVAKGVASVFGKERVVGFAAYGLYTREGVADRQAVGLLALGGEGISVRTALVPDLKSKGLTLERDEAALKAALGEAGRTLAGQVPANPQTRLLVVLADTHSPKNQLLLDGVQAVAGEALAVTGGSANKNAGQNWIHYHGRLYTDAAVALAIDGDVGVEQGGAQAKDNQAVLDSARAVAAGVRSRLCGVPVLFLAFDCAGRKGKLEVIEDEQKALLEGLGGDGALFGVWCAGEFGCADDSPARPVGRGWHLMGTLLQRGGK
jgi:hypothetical protein